MWKPKALIKSSQKEHKMEPIETYSTTEWDRRCFESLKRAQERRIYASHSRWHKFLMLIRGEMKK